MTRRQLLLAFAAAPLAFGQAADAAPRYDATWESLDKRPCPDWYQDARFGIFIHWGVYSVPSYAPPRLKGQTPYAEWYWNSLTQGKAGKPGGAATWDFHKRVYGPDFEYKDFAPRFRAEMFE